MIVFCTAPPRPIIPARPIIAQLILLVLDAKGLDFYKRQNELYEQPFKRPFPTLLFERGVCYQTAKHLVSKKAAVHAFRQRVRQLKHPFRP